MKKVVSHLNLSIGIVGLCRNLFIFQVCWVAAGVTSLLKETVEVSGFKLCGS